MQSALQEEIQTLRRRYRSEADPAGLAFASLADAYRRAGEMEEAWSLLEEGLEEHPDFATGHLVAARVLRDRGQRVEAADRYGRVLDLDPENTEALREAAALAQHDGRIGDALALCQRLALMDPDDADLRARIRTLKEVHFKPEEPEEVEEPAEAEEPEEAEESEPVEELEVVEELEETEEPEAATAIEEPEAPGQTAADEDRSGFGDAWTDDGWTDQPWEPAPETGAREEEFDEPGVEAESLEERADAAEVETPSWMEEEPVGEGDEVPAPDGAPALGVDEQEDAPEVEEELRDELESEFVEGEGPGVYTRTMADLYARQGHVERALRIYGHLLDREPGDEALRERIRELEAEEVTGGEDTPPISAYFDSLLAWKSEGGGEEQGAGEEGA